MDSGFEVAVTDCPAAAGAGEDEPADDGVAGEAGDVAPRLLT